ncbi:MAG TPA: hypothetical protein VFA88_00400 [Gaiellaceae bacterium]|jgi:hypothetical protein|nr:hypothetical protein [Gaiellaceae bacterium]
MLATGQQFAIATGVAVPSEIFFGVPGGRRTEHSYIRAILWVLVLDTAPLAPCSVTSMVPPVRPRTPAPVAEPAAGAGWSSVSSAGRRRTRRCDLSRT